MKTDNLTRSQRALVIRGIQGQIDDITARGMAEEEAARACGARYNTQKEARKRIQKKKALRDLIAKIEAST